MSKTDLTAYRVAAVQMDIVPREKKKNRDHAADLARQAIGRGARLIVFPELANVDMVENAWDLADPVPGPFTDPLEELAAEHGVHVVIGVARRAGDRLYNSAVFVGPQGILGTYDKVHLWAGEWDTARDGWAEDPRRIEPHSYLPGDGFRVFEIDGVSVGAMICYDGLFPESWLCNRQLGAELVLWPTNRGHYRDTNVPALAQLFQVSVMAINRFGQSSYWTQGDSYVIDARGTVLAHAYNGEAVLIADLDVEGLRRWRAKQPQSRDRRPDLYGPMLQSAPGPAAPGIPSFRVAPLWQRGEEQ